MKTAVLLLSSGLDSAANLALSNERGLGDFKVGLALTVDYGQRGAVRELRHAGALARHFGVEHRFFDLSAFSAAVGGKSALLGEGAVPTPSSLDDLSVTSKSAAAVWVPNRNGVLLSIAAAVAESRGFEAVAVGFNAEEAVTFPDNTTDFMRATTEALRYSTSNRVAVVSATAALTKKQIVEKLAPLSFPFELVWSCYHAGLAHCGRCESCQRLKRAVESGLDGQASRAALDALFTPSSGGPTA